MKKEEIIQEPERTQQSQGGQYVPPQQYAAPTQQKSSHGYVVVIVIAVLILGILPIIGIIFAGNIFNNFINSPKGQELVDKVIEKIDDEISTKKNKNEVVGTWDCKSFNGSTESESFRHTLTFNADGTFKYNSYAAEDEFVTGKYKSAYVPYATSEKNPQLDQYKMYSVSFSDAKKHIGDEVKDFGDMRNLTMQITKGESGRFAFTMFEEYLMYYNCYERQ